MVRFRILEDPVNKPRFSSNVIVSSLNEAAKEIGLYKEDGVQVKWDGVCNSHGNNVDAFLCSYEIGFPEIILNNAAQKPIIGVSLHNWSNILEGGYDPEKCGYINLGVD